jgi:hypothetical protein
MPEIYLISPFYLNYLCYKERNIMLLTIALLGVVAIAATVGVFLFIKNNPGRAAKLNEAADKIGDAIKK